MRVLVTGGSGFLGQAVCRQLAERGHTVRVFQRGASGPLEALGIEQHTGDIRDAEAVHAAVAHQDAVIHCAALAGVWGRAREYFDINVAGTANVLEACRRQGVGALVHCSSPAVVHTGQDLEGVDESAPYAKRFLAPYPHSKTVAERRVLAADGADLAVTALRPHVIWGPGDPHFLPRLAERARRGRLRRIGAATSLIDTVYIDNAAEAHVRAAELLRPGGASAGRAYFISQGEPRPIGETVDALLAAVGVPPVRRTIPTWAARALGSTLEYAGRALRTGEPPLTRFVVNQFTTAHWFDISSARRDLGYVPRISMDQGLEILRARRSEMEEAS